MPLIRSIDMFDSMSDNPFDDEEYDRFVVHPGDLIEVTDPEEIASLCKKTGLFPYPEEKQS